MAKKTGSDLLASLAGGIKATPKKKPEKARKVLQLDSDASQVYVKMSYSKQIADIFNASYDASRNEVNPSLLDAYAKEMWSEKSRPNSPVVEVRDENGDLCCTGQFIVQEKISVKIPDVENPEDSVTELLKTLGVVNAESLVQEEVSFTPQIGLCSFSKLVDGEFVDRQWIESSEAEKAVGQKILEFIQSELTPEEQALVITKTAKTVVKSGFLDRVCTYAKSLDQLKAIFKVFSPQPINKGCKLVADTPMKTMEALTTKAASVLRNSNID